MQECNVDIFACDYDSCAEYNFTLPAGNIIVHNYQAASLGIGSQVTINATSSSGQAAATSAPPTTSDFTATTSSGQAAATSAPPATGSFIATTSSGQAAATSPPPTPAATCISPADQQKAIVSATSDNEKKLAAVGAGAGVPLGIAVVAFLALFGLERRRNKRPSMERERSLSQNVDQQGYGGWGGVQEVPRLWNTPQGAPTNPRVELAGMEPRTHEMP